MYFFGLNLHKLSIGTFNLERYQFYIIFDADVHHLLPRSILRNVPIGYNGSLVMNKFVIFKHCTCMRILNVQGDFRTNL